MLIARARALFVYELVAKNGRGLRVAGATRRGAAPQPLGKRAFGNTREMVRAFTVGLVEPNRNVMAIESLWSQHPSDLWAVVDEVDGNGFGSGKWRPLDFPTVGALLTRSAWSSELANHVHGSPTPDHLCTLPPLVAHMPMFN